MKTDSKVLLRAEKLAQPWLLPRPKKLKSKVFPFTEETLLQIVERELDRKYYGVKFRENVSTSPMSQTDYILFYERQSDRYRFLIMVGDGKNQGDVLSDTLCTRLKNKLNRTIFLELARYHDAVGVVKSCYYCDRRYRENTRKVTPASLVTCFFAYTKSGILTLVNAELECTFTHLLVTDDESLEVRHNGQPFCGNLWYFSKMQAIYIGEGEALAWKIFHAKPLADVQGDSFYCRPYAQNHLIIPLFRMIRCTLSNKFVPMRNGGMDDFMIDMASISKEVFAQGGFLDAKGQHRRVTHSRICTNEERVEIQQRIAEELFQIFTRKRT